MPTKCRRDLEGHSQSCEIHGSRQKKAFLGPIPLGCCRLETSSPWSTAKDSGPWYLNDVEGAARQHDKETGCQKTVKRTKQQLVEALEAAGVSLQRNHTKKQLQGFATTHGIAHHVDKTGIRQGWEGKPKGLLQVLWERGFIDPTKTVNCYTVDGKKDPITGDG